ncbi:MAG TPA: DUF4235 domain-containing protein [Gemmatimonadaceae bacterium]
MARRSRRELEWMLVGGASAALAAAAMNRATAAGWQSVTGRPPPDSVTRKPRNWGRVLAWTAATAGAAAMASLLAQEGAAFGWKKVTGKRPPRTKPA